MTDIGVSKKFFWHRTTLLIGKAWRYDSPIDLVNDSTVEAIPEYWQTSVPYYAAYLAYLSAQNGARQADAQNMHDRYMHHVERARKYANPSVNRFLYQQSTDMPQANKIALQKGGGAG